LKTIAAIEKKIKGMEGAIRELRMQLESMEDQRKHQCEHCYKSHMRKEIALFIEVREPVGEGSRGEMATLENEIAAYLDCPKCNKWTKHWKNWHDKIGSREYFKKHWVGLHSEFGQTHKNAYNQGKEPASASA